MSSLLERRKISVFLCFVSACVLSWLIPDRSLAETHGSAIAKSESGGARTSEAKATEHAGAGSEYYVDCGLPETKGGGRSPATAWRALDEVNSHTFSPGDVIYLKRGTVCHGMLWPKGSGSASASIRLSAYGKGPRPQVIANKGDEEAFKLFDQEYWDVDSIEFAGGTIFGVFVSGQRGILHHIHIRNLVVHDVHGGEVKHKESGLVVISPGKAQQHFDDVLVEGVMAYGTEQWAGILVGGGNFGELTEENWSTHVVVRNSVVHDVYGDGIILFRVQDGRIDTSAAWHTGMQPTQSIGTPNAIWTWMCTDCVVSRNEAFLTDSPGVDGGAFDIDYGNTRNSVVNNYGHDTQGYCIAVFGAGYVTRESVVEGNLCIDNGRSPRMALYQGAIFLWTWNNGIIENLRVEKNTVYWRPAGNFPAVLNRADIQGSQRIFRENQIYSRTRSVIESNKNMAFEDNRYATCGRDPATWIFDNHTYNTFDEYRVGAGQEKGSSWNSGALSPFCHAGEQPRLGERGNRAGADKNGPIARGATPPGWTVISELPASIDAQGLLDAEPAGQLVVLKNLIMQFRPSGLRTKITLELNHPITEEAAANLIRDLAIGEIAAFKPIANDIPKQPMTRLVAPDGSMLREWHDFVGPVEIGKAVRDALGEPFFSQM